MSEPTGERFVLEQMGGGLIEAEHRARYQLASQIVRGKEVLDAGCGVGWGTQVLLRAGAAAATGVDLSDEAIANATAREPGATFVRGNLQELPFESKSFDVVTCFEAIEHIEDSERGLDEIQRVLRPGGIVLVSSPNPEVYPAGNPFHIHEYLPEDLLASVATRFTNTRLWRQYNLLASTILVDGSALVAETVIPSVVRSVIDLGVGHDPYSLVVASDGELPQLTGTTLLSPSDQLDHLAEASERLQDDRKLMREDHERIVAEREQILIERKHLLDLLAAANATISDLQATLGTASSGALTESGGNTLELARVRQERDRLALQLLQSEQENSGQVPGTENWYLRQRAAAAPAAVGVAPLEPAPVPAAPAEVTPAPAVDVAPEVPPAPVGRLAVIRRRIGIVRFLAANRDQALPVLKAGVARRLSGG